MVQKIALEEHFLAPGHETYWRTTVGNVDPKHAANLLARLTDFGETRLQSMDQAGIARSVLSIAGPSVQIERDVATATRVAREANDFLAGEVQKRPDRYSGFAHLGMQDPRERRQRARALHARAEILRRHDQRPHPRTVSRPSVALSVLGTRGGARRADLYSSDRSDHPLPGA